MTKFDKSIQKKIKEMPIPDSYHEKVKEVLEKIEEDEPVPVKKKRHPVKAAAVILVLILAGSLAFSATRGIVYAKPSVIFRTGAGEFQRTRH